MSGDILHQAAAQSVFWSLSLLAIVTLTFTSTILDYGLGLKTGVKQAIDKFAFGPRFAVWAVYFGMMCAMFFLKKKEEDPIIQARVNFIYGMNVLFVILFSVMTICKAAAFKWGVNNRSVKKMDKAMEVNEGALKYGQHIILFVGFFSYFCVMESALLSDVLGFSLIKDGGGGSDFFGINVAFMVSFVFFSVSQAGFGLIRMMWDEEEMPKPVRKVVQEVEKFDPVTLASSYSRKAGLMDQNQASTEPLYGRAPTIEGKKTIGGEFEMKVPEYDRYDIDYKCSQLYGAPPEVFGAGHGFGFHLIYKVPRAIIFALALLEFCFTVAFFRDNVYVWTMGTLVLVIVPFIAAGWNGTFGSWFEHWVLTHMVWYATLMHHQVFAPRDGTAMKNWNLGTLLWKASTSPALNFDASKPGYSAWHPVMSMVMLTAVILLLGDIIMLILLTAVSYCAGEKKKNSRAYSAVEPEENDD